MLSIDQVTGLKALQLYGMATAWGELQAEKPRQTHRPETWMDRLLVAEQTDRQLRSLRYQLKAARFPIHRDLLGINWAETPLLQAAMEQLAIAGFMNTAHNLILVGGTGTSGHCAGRVCYPYGQARALLQRGRSSQSTRARENIRQSWQFG